jgi:hypothetical protein|tara:strand:+ start:1310 stop:1576 length:267 start_codon:yes stop_codon:yes gene_type:complete
VTSAEITDLAVGALQGLGASTVFLLALFIGVCVALAMPKLRRGSRKTLVFRNFDDLDGEFAYLPPDAPRGPADQLKTPELLEQASRRG